MPVYFHPKEFERNGKKFLIGHGDGLGPGDHGYKRLKQIFRNPVSKFLFGIFPPMLGMGFANYLSRRSRAQTGATEEIFLGEDKEWLIIYCKEVSVTVPTVFVNGGHYAFALYRAPADFNHQSHAWSRRRVVGASWSYVAESGTGTFSHAFELDVFRPPVVVAPDLWSSCASWSEPGGLMYQGSDSEQRNALDVSCADYLLALAYGLADQVIMMRIAISHALSSHRINGVAATRVDVIGHGVGGLIARLRIDDSTYLTHANFFARDDRLDGSNFCILPVTTGHGCSAVQ